MAVSDRISPEKEDTAIDMMIALVVEMLADQTQSSVEAVMPQFLQSKVCAALYDRKAKLWWEGPSEIASRFLAEQNA